MKTCTSSNSKSEISHSRTRRWLPTVSLHEVTTESQGKDVNAQVFKYTSASLTILFCYILSACTTIRSTQPAFQPDEALTLELRGTFETNGDCGGTPMWWLERRDTLSKSWLPVFDPGCCFTCGPPATQYRNDSVALMILHPSSSSFLISEPLPPGNYRVRMSLYKKFPRRTAIRYSNTFLLTGDSFIYR